MTGDQRQWLVDVLVTMRWTSQLADTMADWWDTETLRSVANDLAVAEAEVNRFEARHNTPRLADSWSPLNDPDSLPARRYDAIMRRATANRHDAERQVFVARDAVMAHLDLADRTHRELALLVSSLLVHLAR